MPKSINPHHPFDVVGEFEEADSRGVEEAVAREAFFEWREQSASARSGAHHHRYPLGVCALLTPWNFPVTIPLCGRRPRP